MTIVQSMKYLLGGWYSLLQYSHDKESWWIWYYIWRNFWRYGVKRDYISVKHKRECSNPGIEKDYRAGRLDAEIYPYLIKLNNDSGINTHFSCWGHGEGSGKGHLSMTISWPKLKELQRRKEEFLRQSFIVDLDIRDFGVGVVFRGDADAPRSLTYITGFLLSL